MQTILEKGVITYQNKRAILLTSHEQTGGLTFPGDSNFGWINNIVPFFSYPFEGEPSNLHKFFGEFPQEANAYLLTKDERIKDTNKFIVSPFKIAEGILEQYVKVERELATLSNSSQKDSFWIAGAKSFLETIQWPEKLRKTKLTKYSK